METIGSVFVAGGTGTAGRAYVRALRAAGYHVRATVRPGRCPGELQALGAEPVTLDLRDEAAVARAMTGAEVLVIAVLGRGPDRAGDEEQITRNLLDAARATGVGRVVYTSVYLADAPTGVPHFEVKGRLEAYIRTSGLRYTILRPCTFMEALTAPWLRDPVLQQGVLMSPIAINAPISYLAAGDLAWFAVRAVAGELDGEVLNLGGPEAVTYAQLLPVLSMLTGYPVEYRQIPLELVAARFGDDTVAMFRLFNASGFTVDMEPVLRRFPVRLTPVQEFLATRWGKAGAPGASSAKART